MSRQPDFKSLLNNEASDTVPVFGSGDESPDTEDSGYTSLRSFIKKRLNGSNDEASEESGPLFKTEAVFEHKIPVNALVTRGGNRLNAIDTEWSAGIEHYIPTPTFRLRVMKERLNKELAELEDELQRYQFLNHPSEETRHKIHQLTLRVETTRLHLERVNLQLDDIMMSQSPFFNLFMKLSIFAIPLTTPWTVYWEALNRFIDVHQWLRRIDPSRAQLNQYAQQLSTLNIVLEKGVNNPLVEASEISDVINQYELTVKQIEQLQTELKTPLFQRLFNKVAT